jgi:CRP/FNR family cyclic AMP-dependent transcriptional regulator
MKTAIFEPGDVIFHQGELSNAAYRILSGKVEILDPSSTPPAHLAEICAGEIFGEMAMVDELPRSAAARCVEKAECEVLTPEDFQAALLRHPKRLIPYLTAYFQKLRELHGRLPLELKLQAEVPAPPSLAIPKPPASTLEKPAASAAPLSVGTNQHSLSLLPMTPESASLLPDGSNAFVITKFPFLIGRKFHDDSSEENDLQLLDQKPYQVSRHHCAIEREGDQFFVRDKESTLGTIVNGAPIGSNHETLSCLLLQGINTLVVGSAKSSFKVQIELK